MDPNPRPVEERLEGNERLGRNICQHAADLIAVFNAAGRRTYSSPSYQRVFAQAGLADSSLFPEIVPEDRPAMQKLIEQTLATGSPQRADVRLLLKDGQVVHLDCLAAPIPDEFGQARQVLVISRDCTPQWLALAKSRQSEALYQSLVESLPQNIFRKDLVGRYTFANRGFCRTVSRPLEEVLFKTDFDFFPPELARKWQEQDRRVIHAKAVLETIEEIQLPAGETRIVHVVRIPVYDTGGHLIGIQVVFWDISEQARSEGALQSAVSHLKKSQEQLNAAQFQLIQSAKLESVGTIAAGIAHEVKNPLQAILSGLDFLSTQVRMENRQAVQTVDNMRKAVQRAYTIVRSLLSFSTAQQPEPTEEDLNAVLAEALLLLQFELSRGKIRLLGDLCPDLPRVWIDKNKMQQVFINLILNSVQAMPQGGTLSVATGIKQLNASDDFPAESRLKTGQPVVWVEIQDSGSGIPEAILDKIFDPFFTTKLPGVGSGLGLTVSKKIVELHRGAIRLRNLPEKGVKATIYLRA